MQWLQDTNQSNSDNLNKVRHDASRHFRNKKKEYLKAKTDKLETNRSKISENCIGASMTFKKGYQPRTNRVEVENGDLVTDSNTILARGTNHFSQLLKVYGVNHVRQTEIYTAEPLVPQPSAFEIKIAIEKLKRHKSPGIDQIPA